MLALIYGHPYDGSFNNAILQTVKSQLEKSRLPYRLLDLYADGFDPAVRKQDLALYASGGTSDSLARSYMEIIGQADSAIFIYPVWWGVEPAIVQGFYDKVFLKDFAWEYSPDGRLAPLLHVERTLIFSTSDAPSDVFRSYFEQYLPAHVFDQVGFFNLSWHNFDRITARSAKERADFLEFAAKAAAEMR